MRLILSTILAAVLVFFGALFLTPFLPVAYEDVTVEQVLATLERFDGKNVRIEGYLVIEFEDVNLYADESDYSEWTGFCLGLAISDTVKAEKERYNRRQAVLEGLLDAQFCGPEYICLSSCSVPGLWIDEIQLK